MRAALKVASGGLVAASAIPVALALSGPGSANTNAPRPDPFSVSCENVVETELYLVPPGDASEAKGRPTSPEAAANRLLSSEAFSERGIGGGRLGALTLRETRTVTLGSAETGLTTATQFAATDEAGVTAATITTEDVGFGTYAVTGFEVCSK